MRISDWSSDVCSSDLLDLVETLRDKEGADAIACEEGEARLEEVEAAKRRELVEHHQQALSAIRVPSSNSLWRHHVQAFGDRKSVVKGKSVSVRVDLGGRRNMQKTRYNPLSIKYETDITQINK